MRERPRDPLDAMREAWRGLAPPPAREVDAEDDTTRAVVEWMQRAYASATPSVPARPRARRSRVLRSWAAAAVLLLCAGGAARFFAPAPAVVRRAADAPSLQPRVILTSADRTVLTAGVVRLTLLNPTPPEESEK